MIKNKIKFAFFGSSRFSKIVLDRLERDGFTPVCVVTVPDKPKGRKLLLTPSLVKEWARSRNIKVHDPEKLDSKFAKILGKDKWDLFVVASYGKIIPKNMIDMPIRKTLNIHPSLLPLYRGASPIQSAMLNDEKKNGVTIIRIDGEMDHGPVVAREEMVINKWPIYEELEKTMAEKGANLLARIMPEWIEGKITEKPQDHSFATYTKKISKGDGLIDPNGDSYLNFRKIQAFHEWPQAYFFVENKVRKIRVKVTRAVFRDGKLTIERVTPEGGRNMPYADFSLGNRKVLN